MTEIRNCPFCGGRPYLYQIATSYGKVWKVMCGARVDCCALLNDWRTREEAIAAWNCRKGESRNAPEFLGGTEPSNGLSGTVNHVPPAGISSVTGGSAGADIGRGARDDERGPEQTAGRLYPDDAEPRDGGGTDSV